MNGRRREDREPLTIDPKRSRDWAPPPPRKEDAAPKEPPPLPPNKDEQKGG